MSDLKNKTLELGFHLEIEDEWPPVAIENLHFKLLNNGYELLTPPLFIKNLSVGDIIDVEIDDNRLVKSWRHVYHSGNSTIWLLRIL